MRWAIFATFLVFPCLTAAQAEPSTLDRITVEARSRNQALRHLEGLLRAAPHRLTGTAGCEDALRWAEREFRRIGLKNIRREKWGEIGFGWERGTRQRGEMTAPFRRTFITTSPAYSPGTEGRVEGEVISEPASTIDFLMQREAFRGKWVLMRAKGTMSGGRRPDNPSEMERLLDGAGILGRIFGSESRDDYVWTNGRYQNLTLQTAPTDVRVMVRASDYRAIEGQLSIGSQVRVAFDFSQRFFPAQRPLENIVAEIPGTEKPDEMVILGAHIDAWDTAGATGASDNGTGVATVLEAARILMKVGAKPKRTIRFIFWTGEEQGLLGSQADAEKLRSEGKLDKVSAVLNEDAGSNWHASLSVIEEQREMMDRVLGPIRKAFPEKPITLNIIPNPPNSLGGSDHSSYNVAGAPGFQFGKSGPQRFRFIWHTQHDTLENVVPEGLLHMSANSALTSYGLANAETLLPRRATIGTR